MACVLLPWQPSELLLCNHVVRFSQGELTDSLQNCTLAIQCMHTTRSPLTFYRYPPLSIFHPPMYPSVCLSINIQPVLCTGPRPMSKYPKAGMISSNIPGVKMCHEIILKCLQHCVINSWAAILQCSPVTFQSDST